MTVKSVDGIWPRLQRLVLPPHCLLCGDDGDDGRDLCSACAASLVPNHICCPLCALPLQTSAPACGECLQRQPPFAAAFAPFLYAHPLDLLMTRLKFGRSLAAGRVLSELWSEAITMLAPALPTIFVPVPLHPSRLRERGYNQAFELLRPLARSLRMPVAESLLARTRATPAQANLDASARRLASRAALRRSSAIARA